MLAGSEFPAVFAITAGAVRFVLNDGKDFLRIIEGRGSSLNLAGGCQRWCGFPTHLICQYRRDHEQENGDHFHENFLLIGFSNLNNLVSYHIAG